MEGTKVTYNGVTIYDLRTMGMSRRAILNGTSYLYTEVSIECEGLVNPALNSFAIANSPVPGFKQPTAKANQLIMTTDQALRMWMLIPRKPLLYQVNGVTIIQSPVPFALAHVDEKQGPIPEEFSIIHVHADQTLEVRFRIMTYINEASLFTIAPETSPPFLLKYAWEMRSSYDRNYYETRTISGTAIFKPSALTTTGAAPIRRLVPDDFRSFLIHPCPAGWKRESLDVIAQEDGTAFTYTIVDKESRNSIMTTGITDIQCVVTVGYQGKADHEIALEFVAAGVDAAADIGSAILRAVATRGRELSRVVRSLRDLGSTGVAFIRNHMPLRTLNVSVTVTGSNICSIAIMSTAAYRVLRSRLNTTAPIQGATGRFNTKLVEERDYGRGVVHLTGTFTAATADQAVQGTQQGANGVSDAVVQAISDLFVVSEDMVDQGVTVLARSNNGVPPNGSPQSGAMTLPNDSATRGASLAIVVAQALQDPLTPPAQPFSPPIRATNPPRPTV